MGEIRGHCLCGVVTYVASGPVLWAGHCHCGSCRRATASPMTSFFGVPRDSVTWGGKLANHLSSDGKVRRQYCAACGTQMTYQFDGWPEETHLYASTLEDPAQFQPTAHFHYAEKLPWLHITDELPKYPGSANTSEPL